jgi:anti-sigma regulatory factor (Ser/Thr protein kinase)
MHADFTIPADLSLVKAVRRAVGEASEASGAEVDRADVELLTSEAVTNAIEHGEPPIHVTLACDGRRVRVVVADAGDDVPVRDEPTPEQIGGRGVWLLDRTATAWGVQPSSEGKAVWFEIGPRRS